MSTDDRVAKSIIEQNKLKQRIWQREMKAEMEGTEKKQLEVADLPEDFNCPICYESMTTVEHTPMTLSPCGHTICKTCIISYQKSKYKKLCPFCNQPYKCEAINHSIIGIVDSIADDFNFNVNFVEELEKAEEKLEAMLASYDLCKSKIEQTERELKVSRAVLREIEGDLADAEQRHKVAKAKIDEAQIESEKSVMEEQRLEEIVTILRHEYAKLKLKMEIVDAGKA